MNKLFFLLIMMMCNNGIMAMGLADLDIPGAIVSLNAYVKKDGDVSLITIGENNETPLHVGMYSDLCLEGIEFLIKNSSNIDKPDKRGVTPLMIATYFGATKRVLLFLRYRSKINLDAQDATGITPLGYSFAALCTKASELALSFSKNALKEDINKAIYRNFTENQFEIIKMLVRNGASLSTTTVPQYDQNGNVTRYSPLEIAELVGCKELEQFIRESTKNSGEQLTSNTVCS